MTSETYEGWSNRETWALALHASNTEHWASHTRELVQITAIRALGSPKNRRPYLETYLKNWVEDIFHLVFHEPDTATKDDRMMAHDVGSLWRVNWREWAENLLEEYEE